MKGVVFISSFVHVVNCALAEKKEKKQLFHYIKVPAFQVRYERECRINKMNGSFPCWKNLL
jgi:hypothetical protein